jgi:hypothetical protein
MPRRGRHPLLDEVKHTEILAVLASGCNRKVDVVPVARYRKRMIDRLGKLLAGAPEQFEKRSRRGKKSAAKTAVFPRNSPSRALPPPEKPQNRLEKPEGTIRGTANNP